MKNGNKIKRERMKTKIFIILMLISANLFASEKNFVGCWIGKIDILRQVLAIKICFDVDSSKKLTGKIDIPQQNAYGLKLSNISCSKDSIWFDLIANVMNVAKFSGRISNPGTEKAFISGSFRQMGMVGTFELEPFIEEQEDTLQSIPIHEEEVAIRNGEVQLAGTFTRLSEQKKYPVVIFISGSGKQDRDENIFGFKIFKMISDRLVRNGYATLRMDDRGTGGSTEIPGTSETIFDFASDIEAAIEFLKTRDDVDTTAIGLLGHSEGAIVAFVVASQRKDIGFVISMAGPTVRGDSLIVEQIRIQMLGQNAPDSLIQETLNQQREIYNIVRNNGDFERARQILLQQAKKQLEFYPEEISSQISKTMIERNIQLQLESMRSDWFRTFIDTDPLIYIEKVQCPILFLFGELDTQVPAKLNAERINHLRKKPGIKIKIVPKANHLFQKARTGYTYEYPILPKKFAQGFFESIEMWMKSITKQK
jgi:pimeloyl-ACP methyl ester carboxylesterase